MKGKISLKLYRNVEIDLFSIYKRKILCRKIINFCNSNDSDSPYLEKQRYDLTGDKREARFISGLYIIQVRALKQLYLDATDCSSIFFVFTGRKTWMVNQNKALVLSTKHHKTQTMIQLVAKTKEPPSVVTVFDFKW